MNVPTILLIYTTYAGFIFNNIIVTILNFGFILLPFLLMMIFNIKSAQTAGSFISGVDLAIKKIEFDFYEMLIVVLLFFIPFAPLKLNATTYEPPQTTYIAEAIPDKINANNDPSIYSGKFKNNLENYEASYGTPKIPVGLYAILKIISGLDYTLSKAMRESIDRNDIVAAKLALSKYNLNDPAVASEVNQFAQDCFMRARSKYLNMASNNQADINLSSSMKDYVKKYPDRALNSFSSRLFQETEGLYKKCSDPEVCHRTLQASQPITGWAYNASRDGVRATEEAALPGRPLCGEWWDKLRDKILKTEPDALTSIIKASKDFSLIFSGEDRRDIAADIVIANSVSKGKTNSLFTPSGLSSEKSIARNIGNAVVHQGIKYTALKNAALSDTVRNAVLVGLAIGLMMVYINIPLLLFFTGFKVDGVLIVIGLVFTMITAHSMLFAVKVVEVNIATSLVGSNEEISSFFSIYPDSSIATLKAITQVLYPVIVIFYFMLMNMVFTGLTSLASGATAGIKATAPTKPPIPKAKK